MLKKLIVGFSLYRGLKINGNVNVSRFWKRASFTLPAVNTLGVVLGLGVAFCAECAENHKSERWSGPLVTETSLVLKEGWRADWLGPLFTREQSGETRLLRYTPLFSRTDMPDLDVTEMDFAYPVLTYDRFGQERRFQILQALSWTTGDTQDDGVRRRFTLFPFYFQQRGGAPEDHYTALVPLHGTIKNRFFRDEVNFTLMPLYVKSRKRDVETWNVPYPFIHVRKGPGLQGWQLWPLFGHEHKKPRTFTDQWNDEVLSPGHDKWFALWPMVFYENLELGTDKTSTKRMVLPFYGAIRSPEKDFTTWMFPFFSLSENKEKKYREFGAPWPLMVFARGEGKTGNRIWPLYSHMAKEGLESRFVLWPLYKSIEASTEALERKRSRILFFLYSDLYQKNKLTGEDLKRKDLWPLFTWRKDFNGTSRLQVFAPLETLLPNNKSIERNYSPVWSLWTVEKNPENNRRTESLLWNLYRRETSDLHKKCSILFGLFQYETSPEGRSMRWFYLPRSRDRKTAQNH